MYSTLLIQQSSGQIAYGTPNDQIERDVMPKTNGKLPFYIHPSMNQLSQEELDIFKNQIDTRTLGVSQFCFQNNLNMTE